MSQQKLPNDLIGNIAIKIRSLNFPRSNSFSVFIDLEKDYGRVPRERTIQVIAQQGSPGEIH